MNSLDLRILALTSVFPYPHAMQRATFNRRQLRILGSEYPVRVIAPIFWNDELQARRAGKQRMPPGRQMEIDGITVDFPRVYHVPGRLRGLLGKLYYWSVRKQFHRVVREFKPTVIYGPFVYPDGWAAVKLAREVGLPVVLKAHGSDLLTLDKYPDRRRGTTEAIQSADYVIAVSRDLERNVIALGGASHKTRTVYCGVEHHIFYPGSKESARQKLNLRDDVKHVLFIGNLHPVKGVDVLLGACETLARSGPEFVLHVIGEGPLQKSLQERASAAGLSGHVRWHGSIPQTKLGDWYRAADVFVLPSRSEGVPNVLLEAAACGTPWISTRVGGIPEIAHMGRGRLIESESPEQLAVELVKMIESPPPMGKIPRCPEETAAELAEIFHHVQAQFYSPGDQQSEAQVDRGTQPILN